MTLTALITAMRTKRVLTRLVLFATVDDRLLMVVCMRASPQPRNGSCPLAVILFMSCGPTLVKLFRLSESCSDTRCALVEPSARNSPIKRQFAVLAVDGVSDGVGRPLVGDGLSMSQFVELKTSREVETPRQQNSLQR